MGWKSTKHISRQTALDLIQTRVNAATNEQLADAVESLGYGDELELEFHGCNFIVQDGPIEDDERAEYYRLKAKFE